MSGCERRIEMDRLVYLDNAATTKTSPTVLEAMLPYFSEYYGNASSIYSIGAKSKEAITHLSLIHI